MPEPTPPTTLHAQVRVISKKALAQTTFFFFKFLLHFILCVWTQHSSQVEVGKQSAKLVLSYYVNPGDWTQDLRLGSKLFFFFNLTLSHLDGSPTLYFWKLPGTFDPFSGKRITRAKDSSSRWMFSWSRVCFAPCSKTGTTWKIHQDIR